uniref:Podospora anserina S mat+ genomic DNA chromosome 7, supercontig 1 n=1 Tax=Caenorhabditis tropicalis TaxID=1561998 RepID=A0A1I7T9E2_9PELO
MFMFPYGACFVLFLIVLENRRGRKEKRRKGELQSLNDYDGNKDLIVSGKALKYIQAVNLGFIQLPKYAPVKSLVGVNSGIGVLGAQAPTGG